MPTTDVSSPHNLPSNVKGTTPEPEESTPSMHKNNDQDKLVPVSESIRYRKRAQSAEQALEQLQSRVDNMALALSDNEQTIASLERRQRIDELLNDADAVDLEAARLLTEVAVTQMEDQDVAVAVEDLRRHKPYLFRQRRESAQAMGLAPHDSADGSPLDHAAEQAVASGDRRDLLRYLRLRRGH